MNLATAIRNGLIRFFPLPITFGEFCHSLIFFLVVALLLMGCSTTKHVSQLVRDVSRDTVCLSNTQYDYIYIYKDKLTDRSRDTIYIKDISVEYRYKLLRDTVKVIQQDSIPYEVVRIETKEITRPLTLYDKLCRISFWFIIGILLSFILSKLKAIRSPF